VLAAALEIIDRDGADALSMRRLARALDRDPMILYRHAPNKAALLDGVAETVLARLTRAGFSGPGALHIYRALFGFLHGHVRDELQELTVSPDGTDDLLRLGLHRLPAGDFLLRGLAPVLTAYDGAAELERGLDILPTGLTTTLTPPGETRPHAPAEHSAS
jgi:AcrR family transcriptional regulator